MATTADFIEFVCEQIKGEGNIRYKKMFGEYMVYINEKPIFIVCNNTVFVKKLDCLKDKMKDVSIGVPYKGAKEHYVLDIDDSNLACEIVKILEPITSIPKKKVKKV